MPLPSGLWGTVKKHMLLLIIQLTQTQPIPCKYQIIKIGYSQTHNLDYKTKKNEPNYISSSSLSKLIMHLSILVGVV